MMRCLLALLIASLAVAPIARGKYIGGMPDCDYRDREKVCLMQKSCTNLAAGIDDKQQLVVMEKDTRAIKTCGILIDIKFISMDEIEFKIFWKSLIASPFDGIFLHLNKSGDKFFGCTEKSITGDAAYLFDRIPSNVVWTCKDGVCAGECDVIVRKKQSSTSGEIYFDLLERDAFWIGYMDRTYRAVADLYLPKMCPESCRDPGKNCPCTSDPDSLFRKALSTRGCDPKMINIITDTDGKNLKVKTDLLGTNASITCEGTTDSQISIREKGGEWRKVSRVFCPDHKWAYLAGDDPDGHDWPRLNEQFDLKFKCYRDYCKYCGKLDPLPCEKCSPARQDKDGDCTPTCLDNKFWYSDSVLKSELKCKTHPKDKSRGAWMGVSNGVEVIVEAASCYSGPYDPLKQARDYYAAAAAADAAKKSAETVMIWLTLSAVIAIISTH